jgi:hypothetical protein
MVHRPLDPQLAERMRRYAQGRGSPSAQAAILAWVTRAEAGAPEVGTAESVADLVRALSVHLTFLADE